MTPFSLQQTIPIRFPEIRGNHKPRPAHQLDRGEEIRVVGASFPTRCPFEDQKVCYV
jgi:hypothetical protein